MKWNEKCDDLKCVQKPTQSRLSLTHHANKSSRWADKKWNGPRVRRISPVGKEKVYGLLLMRIISSLSSSTWSSSQSIHHHHQLHRVQNSVPPYICYIRMIPICDKETFLRTGSRELITWLSPLPRFVSSPQRLMERYQTVSYTHLTLPTNREV